MRKITLLLLMQAFVALIAFGQTRPVTGRVIDEKGEGVPGASILVKGTRTGTAAGNDGQYLIQAKTGDVLVVSGTGIQTAEVTVTTASSLDITVKKADGTLTEVVVTSLGVQRRQKDLGYATAKVSASELTQARATNLQNALTAKVSGLNVSTTNSGVLGNNVRLTLRGIRSLTGDNQPMLIVDGVPVALGFLSSINPNDIQDVNVLKSGAAVAFYGSDGRNGAIVVTTKKGFKTKPTITVSHNTQLERISYMPKFQETYGGGYSQDPITGEGTFEPIEQQSWGPAFDGSIRQFGQTGPNGEKLEMPYAYKKNGRRNFFVTGVTHQSDVSYAAGDFYLSAQNVSIRGTVDGDKNDRRAFTLRSEKETGRFKAGFTIRYTQSQYDVTSNNTAVYYNVTGSPGNYDLSRFKDWKNDYFSSPDGYFTPYLDNIGKTPYFAKDNYRSTGRTDDVFGNAQLDFKAASWLTITYRAGLTYSHGVGKGTRGSFNYSAFHNTLRDHGSLNITSAVGNSSTVNRRLTSELFAKFNKKFDKIGLNGIIGHSYRENSSDFISIGSDNLGTSTLYSVAFRKGEPSVGINTGRNRLERYFASAGIDYNGWAFLEATASYDFDSRLVKPGSYAKKGDIGFFYPSVNASLVLSDAIEAIKGSKTISYLKLRGSYSKTGTMTIGNYGFQTTYVNSTFFPYGDVLGFESNANTVLFADSYEPEFVVGKEAGFELGLFKSRVNLEATYYHQSNTNQVIDIRLSNSTGYTTTRLNAAAFNNYGVEFDLKLTPLVRIGKANINFKVNYTNNQSKVTELIDGVSELGIGNYNYAIVGQPAYVFKLTDYVRDDQGRVVVDRVSGMPEANPNLTQFGRTTPEHILGLSLSANWKNFNLAIVGEYRGGNQMVADQLGAFLDDNGISARSAQFGRRAFVFPNSSYWDGSKYVANSDVYTSLYGRLFWNSDLNTTVITNYLADASFWKLREVSLSYDLPEKLFGSRYTKFIKGVSLAVSGRNLLMFVPKSNQWTDPEFSGGNGNNAYTGNATGRSTAAQFPPTRLFGGTITVKF